MAAVALVTAEVAAVAEEASAGAEVAAEEEEEASGAVDVEGEEEVAGSSLVATGVVVGEERKETHRGRM